MTDRTLVDGNFIQQDESTPGQVKLIVTPADSIGSDGQFLGNVGGVMQMTDLPDSSSSANATIDFQRFNSSGTWTKPSGLNANSPVLVRMWHGGGSGRLGSGGGGGGGGGFLERWLVLSQLGATETVTIGAGGAAKVGADASGSSGGLSSFGTLLTQGSAGGGGGITNGGDGGGPLTAPQGRIVSDGTDAAQVYHGQSGTTSHPGQDGIWHGGGGGANDGGNQQGGNSVYGGGAGGGTTTGTAGAGGTSVNGGNGGNAGVNGASGQAGAQPAGGGGAAENTGGASSGAGGAGRIDVIVFGFPA